MNSAKHFFFFQILIMVVSALLVSSCGYFKVESANSTKMSSQSVPTDPLADTPQDPPTEPTPTPTPTPTPLPDPNGMAKVMSVNSSSPNSFYKLGNTVDISIEFSKAVVVSGGVPYLSLNSGSSAKAFYLSGSNSTTLVFRYTVAAGENNKILNYTASSSLELNNAMIRESSNNEAVNLDLPPVGAGNDLASKKSISIDTTPPTLPSNLEDGVWSNSVIQSPRLTFTDSNDDQSNTVLYQAKIIDNTTSSSVTSFTSILNGSQISSLSLLNGHNYSFVTKAIDLAGNESPEVVSNGWTVDTIAPSMPGVVAIGPVPTNYKQATPTFSFSNSTDDLSGLSHYEIEIRKRSDDMVIKPYTTGASVVTGGASMTLSYAETIDFLAAKETYYANIRAVDKAGNVGTPRAYLTTWTTMQCPTNYIAIPSRPPYTAQGFCVAKYEMKIQGNANGNIVYSALNVAESRSTGTPWVNITRGQAMNECLEFGVGYNLISNNHWQTIAQNAELIAGNWTSGIVGRELMYEGHSDGVPANALEVGNITNRYYQTGNSNTEPIDQGKNQRRTLVFSNGEEIWDFAGNVTEWVRDTIDTNFQVDNFWSLITDTGSPATGTVNNLTGTAKFLFGPAGDYPTLQLAAVNYGGFGRVTMNTATAGGSTAVVRGGRWDGDNVTGAFRAFQSLPSAAAVGTGFRCIYNPQ